VTFNQWIKTKGVDKIAATLNVPVATIYSWSRRRFIPRNAWPDIVTAFAEIGINDLIRMETESKPTDEQ